LEVVHSTRLTYDQPVAETHMELRLSPRDGAGATVERFELRVEPRSPVRTHRDGFGNLVHRFNHVPAHDHVEVLARSVVATGEGIVDPEQTELAEDLLQFRAPVLDIPGVRALARRCAGGDAAAKLDSLTLLISREFKYRPQTTDVYSAVDEVLSRRAGVCQDFAHLFIAVARAMGVPARYVSGYIHAGAGRAGAGASHAWAEALLPGQGWAGYDPTNPVRAGQHHIRLAVGRDYQDVAPTRGTYLGTAREEMSVEVTVRELDAGPL
jgi:transglutaminase-like putative cysteine protease